MSVLDGAVNHRRAILEVLDKRCAGFEYLAADACAYNCPICHEPMRVTFHGELVDLECTAGCDEADVVARLASP